MTPAEIIAFFESHEGIVVRQMESTNPESDIVVSRVPLKALCDFINEKFPKPESTE
jgi:hypothetical protein